MHGTYCNKSHTNSLTASRGALLLLAHYHINAVQMDKMLAYCLKYTSNGKKDKLESVVFLVLLKYCYLHSDTFTALCKLID